MNNFSFGIEAITAERRRQIRDHGYNSNHDREHDHEEFALAASVLAVPKWHPSSSLVLELWPFDEPAKKADDDNLPGRVHELTKAGALIAAELDRIYTNEKAKFLREVDRYKHGKQ